MKTKQVEVYVCEFCGKESPDIDRIICCELDCQKKVFPLVEVDQYIQKKLKETPIVKLTLFPLDDNGKLAYISMTFSDKVRYDLHQPFSLDNIHEYP